MTLLLQTLDKGFLIHVCCCFSVTLLNFLLWAGVWGKWDTNASAQRKSILMHWRVCWHTKPRLFIYSTHWGQYLLAKEAAGHEKKKTCVWFKPILTFFKIMTSLFTPRSQPHLFKWYATKVTKLQLSADTSLILTQICFFHLGFNEDEKRINVGWLAVS